MRLKTGIRYFFKTNKIRFFYFGLFLFTFFTMHFFVSKQLIFNHLLSQLSTLKTASVRLPASVKTKHYTFSPKTLDELYAFLVKKIKFQLSDYYLTLIVSQADLLCGEFSEILIKFEAEGLLINGRKPEISIIEECVPKKVFTSQISLHTDEKNWFYRKNVNQQSGFYINDKWALSSLGLKRRSDRKVWALSSEQIKKWNKTISIPVQN